MPTGTKPVQAQDIVESKSSVWQTVILILSL